MIRRQTALILFLLLLFWLLVSGVRRLSLTFDEPAHLASGYAWLTQGRRSLWTIDERGHPLLVDAWEALPLLVGNPHLQVTDLPGWAKDSRSFASAFIDAIGPLTVSEFAGRIPPVLLTLLLAAIVARWASDIHPLGLLIAPAVMVFDPNLLAHGRLATNDAGVTMLGTLGLFLAWRWGRHPSWPLASLAGIALGLTCLAKASGIIWTATALAWATWLSAERCRTSRCSHLGHVAAMAGADFLCYVTPAEHLGLPTVEDVKEGVIAAKIAAHTADLVKLGEKKLKIDFEMAKARAELNWEKQYMLSVDPEKARGLRERVKPKAGACTMCGEYCVFKILPLKRNGKCF